MPNVIKTMCDLQTVCYVDILAEGRYTSAMESNGDDHQAFYDEMGRRIRDARKLRKPSLTQEGLAKLVGLTRTSITNIERGRQKCLAHTLAEIAQALDIETARLIPPMPSESPELRDALRNRPASEKAWIMSAVTAARKGRKGNGT
jgi:transcriptional regulator with XRE-family HTH domain